MTEQAVDPGRSRPVIAIDGAESSEGRAIFVISALNWCIDWLPGVELKLIDVANEDVILAASVFFWQHGIHLAISPADDAESSLAGADLYAAAAFRAPRHLRLEEAHDEGIPVLLAIQFPDPDWLSAPVLCRRPAAFDPRIFAEELGAIVKPWL
jgi:hypothetical protein